MARTDDKQVKVEILEGGISSLTIDISQAGEKVVASTLDEPCISIEAYGFGEMMHIYSRTHPELVASYIYGVDKPKPPYLLRSASVGEKAKALAELVQHVAQKSQESATKI